MYTTDDGSMFYVWLAGTAARHVPHINERSSSTRCSHAGFHDFLLCTQHNILYYMNRCGTKSKYGNFNIALEPAQGTWAMDSRRVRMEL